MKKNLNVNVEESRDLAFLELPLEEKMKKEKKAILDKYHLKENEYITIVGTALAQYYTKNINNFYEQYIQMIKNLMKKYKNKKIVWLSHVTVQPPGVSDNTMLDKLNQMSNNFINENLIVIKEPLLPVEARCILGSGYYTITSRMHAAISTFEMGKPAICLSYSVKYKGVISNGLGMNKLVIEAKNDELWEKGILESIDDKINYVEENYEFLLKKINENIEKCKKSVQKSLNDFVEELVEEE